MPEFQQKFEAKLSSLIEQHLKSQQSNRAAVRTARPDWNGNPFRGLSAFEFEHAPIYFGWNTHPRNELRDAWEGEAPAEPSDSQRIATYGSAGASPSHSQLISVSRITGARFSLHKCDAKSDASWIGMAANRNAPRTTKRRNPRKSEGFFKAGGRYRTRTCDFHLVRMAL